MITIDSLQDVASALFDGTIADPIWHYDLLFSHKNNTSVTDDDGGQTGRQMDERQP